MPDRSKSNATVTRGPRMKRIAAVPVLLVVIGSLGYRITEGWPLEDCIYMTVITLTTVGFSEVHPMTHGGRLFTMVLALGGIFTLFWAATEVVRSVAHGEFQSLFGRQRMERRLAELENHYIVCGLGRMGRQVTRELENENLPYVVVDQDQAALDLFIGDGTKAATVLGDATRDGVLERVGVPRARGLIACASSDADNVFITMSARMMNSELFIVARAEDDHTKEKLTRAGASRVVTPYTIGGHHLAQAMLRPNVVEFIELATKTDHLDLQIEEIRLSKHGACVGKTLQEWGIRERYGAMIVAVKTPDGGMVYNPGREHRLEAGHRLIVLAKPEAIRRFAEDARGK